ncbi:MAG TPA: FHA domain-containing protein [Actinomycetes bacterium]
MDETRLDMVVVPATLLVVAGLAEGTMIPVPPGELLLGREAGQAGRLGGDRTLSRRHARVIRDGQGRLFVEDLGSTNGTLLNGARVTGRQPLRAGDLIEVGESTLEVVDPTSQQDVAAGSAAAGLLEDESDLTGVDLGWMGQDEAEASNGVLTPPRGAAPAVPPGSPSASAAAADDRRGPVATTGPRRGRGVVEGQVRGIRERTESMGESSSTLWAFRIERYDRAGNRLPPVAAQMRAVAFDGSLSEGDEVRVIGTWKDGTLHGERVENLTTRATVKPKSFKKAAIAFVAIFLAMVVGFVTLVVVGNASFQRQTERAKQEFCQEATSQSGSAPPGC